MEASALGQPVSWKPGSVLLSHLLWLSYLQLHAAKGPHTDLWQELTWLLCWDLLSPRWSTPVSWLEPRPTDISLFVTAAHTHSLQVFSKTWIQGLEKFSLLKLFKVSELQMPICEFQNLEKYEKLSSHYWIGLLHLGRPSASRRLGWGHHCWQLDIITLANNKEPVDKIGSFALLLNRSPRQLRSNLTLNASQGLLLRHPKASELEAAIWV